MERDKTTLNRPTLQNLALSILYIAFFGIGAAALCLAFVAEDLVRYYNRRHQLSQAERVTAWLEQLNADYQALLAQAREDPNMLRRLGPAVLGIWPNEPNTAYPRARSEELLAATQAVLLQGPAPPAGRPLPRWLSRCRDTYCRWCLAAAGAGLILISITCLGAPKAGR